MTQHLSRLTKIGFILLDLLLLNITFLATKAGIFKKVSAAYEIVYGNFHLFINIAWIVAAWFNGVYKRGTITSFEKFCKKTVRAFTYFIAFNMLCLYFLKQQQISRAFVLALLTVMFLAFIASRLVHFLLFRVLRSKDYLTKKVLIVGHNSTATKLTQYLEAQPVKTEIVGFCEEEQNVHELTNYPVIGDMDQAMELSKQHGVTEIYSTIAPEQNKKLYSFMKEADDACIRFKFIPDLNAFIRQPVHIDYLGEMPMFSLRREPLDDIANRIKKRFYDLSFSMMVVVFLLSWLVPLLSLLICMDSKGPVFFIQKRTGINNKPFNCIKFRTMKVNRDADKQQAKKNDPRFTRLGRFLRKSNLDELPQFFNVLMSDMSIVGPRPHMIKHTEDYSKIVPKYMVRQFLKPGITGWAQTNGYRGETKTINQMESRVAHDLWYMENWSLWLDTKIIFMTAVNMIKGDRNAY